MREERKVRKFAWLVLTGVGLLCLTSPGSALACAACYGQSDSPLAAGMNWGIFTLLGFIGSVLVGVAAFFVYLVRRSNRLAAEAEAAKMALEVG